jgi:hypothetical protein
VAKSVAAAGELRETAPVAERVDRIRQAAHEYA